MCANPKAEWVKKLLEQLRYDMLTHFKMSIRGCLDAHLKICKSIKRFVFGISHVRTTYFFSAKLKNMSKGGSVKKTGNASGRDGSGSDLTATEAFTAY